jgi:DNA replication protein DnaC
MASSNLSELSNLFTGPTEAEIAEQLELEKQDEQRREMARRKKRWDKLVGEEGGRYASCTLESYVRELPAQKAAWQAVREYVAALSKHRAAGEGILFYGRAGTGKDHLAIAILRHAILDYGCRCERVNGCEWFGDVRDAMDAESRTTEKRLISDLAGPDLLLISDPLPPIGALSQHQATMLHRVVEARYFAARPTLVTVNVRGGKEATARMGVATWDRLKHGALVIACGWDSFRKPSRIVNGKE